MHLTNILNHLGATAEEAIEVATHFADKVVSFTAVRTFIESKRAAMATK